jgi:hypothetical protein
MSLLIYGNLYIAEMSFQISGERTFRSSLGTIGYPYGSNKLDDYIQPYKNLEENEGEYF